MARALGDTLPDAAVALLDGRELEPGAGVSEGIRVRLGRPPRRSGTGGPW
jgi:hypothetical protein